MQKSRDWIEDVMDPRPRVIEPSPMATIGSLQGGQVKRFDPGKAALLEVGRKGGVKLQHPPWHMPEWEPWPVRFRAP